MPQEYDLSEFGVSPKNQTYDLSEFGINSNPEKKQSVEGNSLSDKEKLRKLVGTDRDALSPGKDVLSGMAKGGENLARLAFGKNTAEAAQSDNPNPLLFGAGQYAPAIAAGGASALGQAATNAPWAALQYQEGDKNAFGLLPSNRTGAAIEGALTPLLPKGIGLAAKTAALPFKIAKGSANLVKNAVKSIDELKTGAEQAGHEAQIAEAQQKQAEGYSFGETGKTDEAVMQAVAQQKKSELAGMQEPESSNLPAESSRASGMQLDREQQAHTTNQEAAQQTEQQMREHLNEGGAHRLDLAQGVHQVADARRAQLSQTYDHLTDAFADQNVHVDNTAAIRQHEDRLMELARSNELEHSPEAARIYAEIERLRNMEGTVPANEMLTTIRSLRDYSREARRQAYSTNINAEARQAANQRYNELDDQVEQLAQAFENGVGGENAQLLRDTNHAWRTEVKPLQRNRTYQRMRPEIKGSAPKNTMDVLAGSNPGDVIMRNIIQNDPNLLRQAVGQRYADNPLNIRNANAIEREYIGRMPELNAMLDRHEMQQHAAQQSQERVTHAEQRHQTVTANETQAQRVAEKQQEALAKHKDQVTKLNEDIRVLEHHIDNLDKTRKQKGLSLDKKVKAEKAYKEAKEARETAQWTLAKIVGGLGLLKIGQNILGEK